MKPTEVRMPRSAAALVLLCVLVPSIGLGFGLPALAGWLRSGLEATPIPVPGAVGVVADLPLSWSVPIVATLGLVGGTWIALAMINESLQVTVFDDHLEHRTDGGALRGEGWVERSEVAAVFRDGRHLVLLAADGRVRSRLDADDLPRTALRDAFVAHSWPWTDADPYETEYVGWVDGRPGFTDEEHALLRRRDRERRDAAAVQELDAALGRLGLAARVRDGRLQVRRCDVDAGNGGRGASR
ncbi:hypothetical protein UQW22_01585 [Isoptericola halotolerans]|uniref:YqeB family protein n=1 Tax=Isoptericola halotolerans TaxID=300560 RepID=UPI00388D9C3A